MITILSFILLYLKTHCLSDEEVLQEISNLIPVEFSKTSPSTLQINYIDMQSIITLTIFSIKPLMIPNHTSILTQNNTIIYHNIHISFLFNISIYINPVAHKSENTLIITKLASTAELFFDSITFTSDLIDNHIISLSEPKTIYIDFTPWDKYVYFERFLSNNDGVIKHELFSLVNATFNLMLESYPMGETESIFLNIVGFIEGYNEFEITGIKDVMLAKLRRIIYDKAIRKGKKYSEFINISLELFYYNRNGIEIHEYLQYDKASLLQKKITLGTIVKGGVTAKLIAEQIFNIAYEAIGDI